ncbi:uncharacterized protein [Argopecten irradians]|uniref:uncharacterized protein n=1 Tax=Argopecten irradians TaxID=31199 RepID=UPI00371E401C
MDCRHTNEDLMILFDTDDRFQSAKTRIIKSNVLVIDEIGMMSKTVLEMLELVCRYVRGNTSVFGGLQVIATGDFKQLPPVPNRRFDDDGSFCFLSPLFQKTFPHHINLQQVVRQNEEDLVQTIHELCDGDPSKETEQLLRRLIRPLHNAVDVVKLFGTNFDADYINHEMLNSIDGNDKVYKSVDEGEVKLLMHSAAPKNLLLKVSPVILIRNLEHNLFNGTRGVVAKLTEEGPVISVAGKNVPVPLTKFEVYDKTKKILDFAQDLSCCRHTVDEDTSSLSQKSSEDYDNEEPYESPSSDSEADINLHRQCPWDVKESLELNKGSPCVSDKPSGFGETEILKKHVQQGLGDNEDLLDEWIRLFSNTLGDREDEVFLSLLLDLYSVVNEHFVRIALLEGLHTFKTLIRRKKKQAVRQKLQALGEKKTKEKGEKRKMPTPEVEEDDEYLCKECATEKAKGKAEEKVKEKEENKETWTSSPK